ncbi:unnamed protein product [Cuscuta campestris]|uniref:CCHC-type domain-containing protein n=1 Tax=Cuscuta campestris TaxID=132261 RepID=A0A484L795_9ASTE|nr:unnamed protein product [Cuscuta campestris]
MLNEEMRRKVQGSSSQSEVLVTEHMERNANRDQRGRGKSRSKSKSRYKNVACHYCHNTGHIKKNCFKWKRDNKPKGKNEKKDEGANRVSTADLVDDLIFVTNADVVNAVSDDQSWVIDSGAMLHVTPRKEFFTSLKAGSFGKLKMGNDAVVEVVGIGDVCLVTQMGTKLLLKDVRYAPDVRLNFISVHRLDDEGYENHFGGGQWKLKRGNLVVARGKKESKLYRLESVLSHDVNGDVNVIESSKASHLWHRRLSHISEKGLNLLAKKYVLPVEKKLVRSRDVVFMENQTIEDIDKARRANPTDSYELIDVEPVRATLEPEIPLENVDTDAGQPHGDELHVPSVNGEMQSEKPQDEGSLFPLVVRRKGIFLRVEVLECGISEQVLLRLVGLEFSGCNGLLSTRIGEGQSTTRPPLFDGTNYTYLKERMRIYIRSTNLQLWLVIKNGEEVPMKKVGDKLIPKTEDEFDTEDIKKVENYAKAINMLYCAVNPDDYRKISCCSTAKEMWDKLEVTYEGTDQVREAKIDFLTQEYEMFRMKEHEKIDDMFDRFSKIVNDLHALKKTYTDRDLVRKILWSLTSEWRSKADAIYESISTSNVTIDGLRGNLKTYESTILNLSLNDQRKGIALKAFKEPTMNDPSDDDEVKLVMKKFCKLLRKKEKVEDGPVCYGCGEAGHIKNKCPRSGRNACPFKKQRAYISWGGNSGDESSEQEEDEEANLCLIAQEEEESANDESQELRSARPWFWAGHLPSNGRYHPSMDK